MVPLCLQLHKPLLLLVSAHVVVIRAALLSVVHFPVIIKHKYVVFCHSHLKYGGLVRPDDVASLKYRHRFLKPKYLEISYQI